MSRKTVLIFMAFVIATFFVFTPSNVIAAAPAGELDAAIIGSAEFALGTEDTVQIAIQNNKTIGEIETIARQAGLSSYYGLAVGVTAVLKNGNAPITVKTEKVLIGNISSGATFSPVSFLIAVNKDALPGPYQILLELAYQELIGVTSGETTNLEWANKTVSKDLNIEIVEFKEGQPAMPSDRDLDAAIVGLAEFAPGSTNTIQISIQNNKTISEQNVSAIQAGLSNYYDSVVGLTAILKKGDAPIAVKTDKVLVGNVPIGVATPPIPFTIEVDETATPGSYLMVLELTYKELSSINVGENINFDWVDRIISNELNIVIKQEPVEFEVTNIEPALWPGVQKEIKITFRNSGSQIARNCEARLSAADPLSLTSDVAFLGDLEPDDTAIGIFRIKVKGDAIPKEYALDAQIKYTGYDGEEHISKVLIVPLQVNSRSSSVSEIIKTYLPGGLIGAGLVAVIWIIWFVWFRVKPIVID